MHGIHWAELGPPASGTARLRSSAGRKASARALSGGNLGVFSFFGRTVVSVVGQAFVLGLGQAFVEGLSHSLGVAWARRNSAHWVANHANSDTSTFSTLPGSAFLCPHPTARLSSSPLLNITNNNSVKKTTMTQAHL